MTPHASAITRVADSVRGTMPTSDVPALVRRCKDAGIPVGPQELAFVLQRLGRSHGEHYVPTDVAELIAQIVEPFSPKTLLDPWAGAGLLAIPVSERLRPERYDAYTPSHTASEVFQMLQGSPEITIHCADPLEALRQSSDQFDAVVGNTPFGMRAKAPL